MINKALLLFFGLWFISNTNSMGLNPLKEYKTTPAKINLKFEEGNIQTSDGASLAYWYFPSARITNKLIIVSHNGDGNMGNNLSRIKALLSFGFNVLCYDYRGFGASSDFTIDDETYLYAEFYSDFEAVYNYAVNNYGKKLYLYGWGIGATITNTIGYNKPNTYTIISDGSISQFTDMPSRFKKINSRMSIHKDVLSTYKDPYTTFGSAPSPNFRGILFIVGSNDYLLTTQDMEDLKEQVKTGSQDIYILPNKRSWDNYRSDPSSYIRRLHMFLVNN
ncbi:MAG: putative alpha/beta hydrolase [Cyclobacteriaceae bacterium]|jgi:predicted alpha/beta hydrolase